MEIVIDIPDEIYNTKVNLVNYLGCYSDRLDDIIYGGTPIPKGHGRLIDESEITSIYYHEEKAEQGLINFRGIVIDGTDAPTIIEADGGGEDG